MTVGIAALAEDRAAIVLMADKQLTENDPAGVKIEGQEVKGFRLDNGWLALYAGDGTFASVVVAGANANLSKRKSAGNAVLDDPISVMGWLRDSFLEAYQGISDYDLFGPNFLERERFTARTYDEATTRRIEALVADYQENGTADLLICGFDASGRGHVISIGYDSAEIGGSYATIGTGGPLASAHLAWRKTTPSDRLHRVVYEVFEAKSHAELSAYVGPTTDALVMVSNDPSVGTVALSKDTKDILTEVMRYQDVTPFTTALRAGEERRAPREGWEKQLTEEKLGPVVKLIEGLRIKREMGKS